MSEERTCGTCKHVYEPEKITVHFCGCGFSEQYGQPVYYDEVACDCYESRLGEQIWTATALKKSDGS